MIGILGSGFGLYGYLPAFAMYTDNTIALLKRYQDKFKGRPELLVYEKRIKWIEEESVFLDSIEGLVVSLNPESQVRWINKALHYKKIKYLWLEKPLATSPTAATALLKILYNSEKKIRIGYIFQYTDWGKKLIEILSSGIHASKIQIQWSFMAYHYKYNLANWKRFSDSGGAVIKFYGIHLIALAALLGYTEVQFSNSQGLSENDLHKWSAILVNKSSALLETSIHARSDTSLFSVKIYDNTGNPIWQIAQPGPFDSPSLQEYPDDPRVDFLSGIIQSIHDDRHYYHFYEKCNLLWRNIEKYNTYTVET